MLHIEPVKQKRSLPGTVLSAVLLAAVLAAFLICVRSVSGRTAGEQLDILENAIRRASVQCYAIEGRYPPSVEYLEENYGIQIDRERYHVFYEGFASNVMPDITVIPAESP